MPTALKWALGILGIYRRLTDRAPEDSSDALASMLRLAQKDGLQPSAANFAEKAKGHRERALAP